ncbi:MAG: divalent cation tolerance protein CutA [Sphingomonas fennica]
MIATIAILTTTVASAAEADALAAALVGERLAACVQSAPVRSCYRWEGAVTTADERLLTIKTAPDRAAALAERLATLHPYDLPEIVTVLAEASVEYAAWVREETSAFNRD